MLLSVMALLGGVGYTLHETSKADEYSQKALLKRERAIEKENNAYRKLNLAEKNAENSIKKLFNLKKGISTTSLIELRRVFEPISTLSFLKTINCYGLQKEMNISPLLTDVSSLSTIYSAPMTQQQQITSLLFGACGVMHAEKKMQEQELAYASKQLSMAKLLEDYANNEIMVLETIKERNDMIWELLRKLNILLTKSIKESKKSIVAYGRSEEKYSDNEIDNLRFTLQLADVICKLCEASLLTKDGEFIQQSSGLIKRGNAIISEVNEKIELRRG